MVSTSFIFRSFSPFSNLLRTVLGAPITIGIIVIFMFHSFFIFLATSLYLSLFLLSFNFILFPADTAKSAVRQFLYVLFCFFNHKVWPSRRDYNHYFTLCGFLINELISGYSQRFEWKQVSSVLQDSPMYSSWFLFCYGQDVIDFFNDLLFQNFPFCWGWRIRQLLLCWREIPLQQVSWIWH